MKKAILLTLFALSCMVFAQESAPPQFTSLTREFNRAATAAAARAVIGATSSGSGGALTNAIIYGSTSGSVNFSDTAFMGILTATPVAPISIAAGGGNTLVEFMRLNRAEDANRYNSIFTESDSGGDAKIQFRVHDGVGAASQATVMTLRGSGSVGINTSEPELPAMSINHATGNTLDLIYNDSNGGPVNHVQLTVSSGGVLTIAPTTSTTTPTSVLVTGKLATTATSVTIAAAAATFAITSNVVTVTGDAGANTVTTITGGVSGQILTLIFADGLVTITDDAGGGANTINLSAAWVSSANDVMQLVFNGTSWREASRSVN